MSSRSGRTGRYVPGGRGWIKTKNREYWRYENGRLYVRPIELDLNEQNVSAN